MLDRAPRFRGWATTDEEEIERRRQRGATEPLQVEALEPDHPVFGTFRVGTAGGNGGIGYEVEIRSLSRRDNSCNCPDFQVNGLGTCKHVEAVLARVAKGRGARTVNPRIEVFLRLAGDRPGDRPEVRVQWPEAASAAARALVAPFFTKSGALRGDPLTRLPALARALSPTGQATPRVRRQIRLSRHLAPWAEEQRRRAARRTSRERFLAEVAAGRQTLDVVKHPLYPYQQEGMLHLAFTERALLADEMGLGKTVQAVAACALLRRLRGIERVLVISPASLKAEWEEQIARFTDLPVQVIQGDRARRLAQYAASGGSAFFYLANYEQILSDGDEIQRRLAPDVVILDEAQRIKNWQSRTAQAVKRLRSPYAFVLTGTPLENRIDEVYSIAQFLDPTLFGPLFRFNRTFYELDERGRPAGYRNLDELRRRLTPVLLRRRKDEVEEQLPGRTDKHYLVPMEDEQANRYMEYQDRVARLAAIAKRRPLTPQEFDQLQQWLACMRMLCDTPYILDADCRICPKLPELEQILGEVLADPAAKVLIFSEWERMLELVRELVQEMGAGFAWHTGSVPQQARRREIRRFKDDPDCRLFLSTDSGGVGLNLQAANVVINLDLPWNPARLEQRIARAWRKHQTRPVQVLHLVTEDSIEHRMISLLEGKQRLADIALDGRGDANSMPLPSGRRAMIERLEALTGRTEPAAEKEEEPRDPRAEDLLAALGERLLLAESRLSPDGRETLLLVVEPGTRLDGPAGTASGMRPQGPALELIDRAAFAAVERLIEAGVLQFTSAGSRLLHRAPGFAAPAASGEDREKERRLAQARQTFAQAERKLRMAAVLAAGGFPQEALPALRDGVELALRARAQSEGAAPEHEAPVPLEWVRERFPDHQALVERLRDPAAALEAEGQEDPSRWITAGEQLAREIEASLAPGTC